MNLLLLLLGLLGMLNIPKQEALCTSDTHTLSFFNSSSLFFLKKLSSTIFRDAIQACPMVIRVHLQPHLLLLSHQSELCW